MSPERHAKLQEIFEAAIELSAAERSAYLREACRGDSDLREHVERLIAADQPPSGSLSRDTMLRAPEAAQLVLTAGQRLANFEVVSLLGRGGMGEVYRARDLRLRREVAIKVLHASFANEPDRIVRFEREARAASALNHANIVTVYDVGADHGVHWIASELIAGESLQSLMSRGPLAARAVTDLASQIADGLAAAHACGIVHRDLKPGNLMVTPERRIKILDFGLAKRNRVSPEIDDTDALQDLTEAGVIMGTAAYMSPEQIRGADVDHRSDIFSLGSILYQMVSGARAFDGSQVEVLSAILKSDPAPLPSSVPEALRRIVNRCLEKQPARRFQSASDLGFALRSVSEPTTVTFQAKREPKRSRLIALFGVLGIGVVILLAIGFWLKPQTETPLLLNQKQITNDGQTKFANWIATTGFPITTDGPRIFFTEFINGTRVIRQVTATGGEVVPVPGAPDGSGLFPTDSDVARSTLLLTRDLNRCCELWAVPMMGGSPRRVGDFIGRDGVWSPGGDRIAYVGNDHGQDGCIFVARSDGSEPRMLVSPNSAIPAVTWVRWSPDGQRLRFTVEDQTHAGSLWEVAADGTNLHPLLPGWSRPGAECCGSWTSDGRYFVFESSRDGNPNIWALREPGFLHARPNAVRLTNGPLLYHTPTPSRDGSSIFVLAVLAHGDLVKVGAEPHQAVPLLRPLSVSQADFSRDGTWLAYTTYPDNLLWASRADGSQRLQLTSPGIEAGTPRWSPDGKEIAFAGRRPHKPWSIYTIAAAGGTPHQLTSEGIDEAFPDWSPDGTRLAFCRLPRSTPAEELTVRILEIKTGKINVLQRDRGLYYPRWSPDRRYLAVTSRGEGDFKIMLLDLINSSWINLASGQGYAQLAWSKNGQSLYYSDYPEQGPTVYRVRISDRRIEQVAKLGDITLLNTDLGSQSMSGLAPDESPIAVRDTGTQELYALSVKLP